MQEGYWSEAWIRHVENYLSSPPRCGYWLKSKYPDISSIIEIAGGSCRDSLFLSRYYDYVIGSDFDEQTLQYLKSRYPDSKSIFSRQDGFKFDYDDKTFELSFSNGFWVLFPDDKDIKQLIREQARITKRYLVSLVHNVNNKRLKDAFNEKSKTDSLYNIRFFNQDEIINLVETSGVQYKSISVEKFGGPLDILLSKKFTVDSDCSHGRNLIIPKLYQFQPWKKVERIAVIVELI
jgi:hypothetical protein